MLNFIYSNQDEQRMILVDAEFPITTRDDKKPKTPTNNSSEITLGA